MNRPKRVKFALYLSAAVLLLAAYILYDAGVLKRLYDMSDLDGQSDKNYVAFLDVGQADCTLVYCEGKYILIDAGGAHNEGILLSKKLLTYGVRKIDTIIMSHDHTDHAGGLYKLMSDYEVGSIICSDGAFRGDDHVTQDILDIAEERKVDIISATAGDTLSFASAEFDFLWLDERIDENDRCLVFILKMDGKRFFFGGDITAAVEKRMIEAGTDVKCDVLKASHHGSSGSNSDLLLDSAKPLYCIASCGKDNRYGFPSDKFCERIDKRGIILYVTADQGDIIFNTTDNMVSTKK